MKKMFDFSDDVEYTKRGFCVRTAIIFLLIPLWIAIYFVRILFGRE